MSARPIVSRTREGAIAPLAAIFTVFILGMVAFAIDTSWIVLTQSELQNAADSAALAGANKLIDGMVSYNLPGQSNTNKSSILSSSMTSARAAAKEYAGYNGAGGINSLSLLDADIEFGFTNSSNVYTAFDGSAPVFPNTIKVVLRRDSTANGALSLFFAPAIGTKSTNLTATASATLFAGQLDGVKSEPNLTVGMLPVAYDVNHWNNFVSSGKDSDGGTRTDSAGNPILQVYPSIKDTGNFGLLSLDDEHASANDLRGWIHGGMTADDISTLTSRNLIPVSAHNPNLWDWHGSPGFKAANVMDVNEHQNETYLLPLFKPVSAGGTKTVTKEVTTGHGKNQTTTTVTETVTLPYEAGVGNGTNYYYNIVGFVGIRIMYTSDSNREIVVQPAAVIEPNAIFKTNTLKPADGSDPQTVFSPPKLVR